MSYVSSKESCPGKSSSNIVTFVVVSSPGNTLLLSFGSYNSTVNDVSGYQSLLSIILIWTTFSLSDALKSITLSIDS